LSKGGGCHETHSHFDTCGYRPNRAGHLACASRRIDRSRRQCRRTARLTLGWSAKRQILGHAVYNDSNERIGSIDDVIVASDKTVSYAIINAGGFLAVAKHDVAVPVSKLTLVDDRLVLPGATKEALKASPRFEYAN
jgi:sporulation protein YlmC with PRC-barrel domain